MAFNNQGKICLLQPGIQFSSTPSQDIPTCSKLYLIDWCLIHIIAKQKKSIILFFLLKEETEIASPFICLLLPYVIEGSGLQQWAFNWWLLLCNVTGINGSALSVGLGCAEAGPWRRRSMTRREVSYSSQWDQASFPSTPHFPQGSKTVWFSWSLSV